MEHRRSVRVGLTAIFCAVLVRLWAWGLPERIAALLARPETGAFLTYLETGKKITPAPEGPEPEPAALVFGAESPPPYIPEPALPVFSAGDAEAIRLYNTSGKQPDLGSLLAQPLSWDLTEEDPAVLILHTHSTESYTKNGEGYTESSSYRTLDENYNMLSIGAHVAALLEEAGIGVVQDRELHDYPSYNGSYVDARGSIQEFLEAHPSIQLVLDLHRDAAGTVNNQLRTLAEVEGQTSAQLMLVMGTNYDTWQQNLSLALKLQLQLEAQAPGITRPICLRSSRFNQDLCPGALLVEVGAAGNTRAEALLAADQLAQAIIALAGGTESGA